jgi:dynein heavy chain, axonemal
VFHAVVVER